MLHFIAYTTKGCGESEIILIITCHQALSSFMLAYREAFSCRIALIGIQQVKFQIERRIEVSHSERKRERKRIKENRSRNSGPPLLLASLLAPLCYLPEIPERASNTQKLTWLLFFWWCRCSSSELLAAYGFTF